MDYKVVLELQKDLAEDYKYKAIPQNYRAEIHNFYKDNLPPNFRLEGDAAPLFSSSGLKLCEGYNRVVIGDYGAFVEVAPSNIVTENIQVQEGQEFRDFNPRYNHTVFSWLTPKGDSGIKISFQKRKVEYGDFKPGFYYISPYDCFYSKSFNRNEIDNSFKEKIDQWLKGQGEYTENLAEHFYNVSVFHKDIVDFCLEKSISPYDLDYWLKLNELCGLNEELSFTQFEVIKYNLAVIECTADELQGSLETLKNEIKMAITLGIEETELPYDAQKLNSRDIRQILNMSCEDLLILSRFSKFIAGCKAEELIKDDYSCNLDDAIKEANLRVEKYEKTESKDYELVK